MSRRKLLIAVSVLAIGCADAAALQSALSAMDCCVRHECAGIKTADDCCQGMGHSVTTVTSAPPDQHILTVAVSAILALVPSVDSHRSFDTLADPLFKRPHDPPHLHPVPLLI